MSVSISSRPITTCSDHLAYTLATDLYGALDLSPIINFNLTKPESR